MRRGQTTSRPTVDDPDPTSAFDLDRLWREKLHPVRNPKAYATRVKRVALRTKPQSNSNRDLKEPCRMTRIKDVVDHPAPSHFQGIARACGVTPLVWRRGAISPSVMQAHAALAGASSATGASHAAAMAWSSIPLHTSSPTHCKAPKLFCLLVDPASGAVMGGGPGPGSVRLDDGTA